MEKDAKEALQVTKEIVVKFIETSRVSPANFAEIFPAVYQVVLAAVSGQGSVAASPGKDSSSPAKAR
jgi:hypothetical protein